MTDTFPWQNTSGRSQNSTLRHQFLWEVSHSFTGPEYTACFNHWAGLYCQVFIPPCGSGGRGSWKSGLLDILLPDSKSSTSFPAAISYFKKAPPPETTTLFRTSELVGDKSEMRTLVSTGVLAWRRRPHL